MRISFAFIMFCFLSFWPHLVMAEDQAPAHARTNKCTLKNKVFCGEWQDAKAYYLTITGDHILYHDDAEPNKYDCEIVYELTEGENPFSLLKCKYFDAEDQKYYTDYKGFYISDWSRRLDKRSPDFQSITQNSSGLLQRGRSDSEVLGDICDQRGGKLFCDPEQGASRGPLSRYK
jgi:hypothetical protein